MNERVTPDRAVEEIYDRNGLTEAEAGDFVAEKKAEAEKLYTEASNEPVTRNTGEGLSEFAQHKAAHTAKVEGLKRNLDKWNQIEAAAERRNMTKTGAELTAIDLDARERDIKRQTEERVDELAKKLGDVEKVYDISEVTNPDALAELRAGRTIYGWYDKKKDKVVLYMPNVTDPGEATRTIIHEQVIHRGLSKMFGEDYDNVLAEVYDKVMTPSEQQEFYGYVNGPKKGKAEDIRKKQLEAADEWIAGNYQNLRFKQYNVWDKIVSSVRGILRKNGFDVDYTRRDIENLVRDSYRNLERSGVKEGDVTDVAGNKEREGIMLRYYDKEVNDRFNEELEQQINGTLPRGHIYQMGMPGTVLRACGFPDMPIEMSSTNLAEHARKTHHPFELKDVKDLVRALQEPVAVFAYGNKDKSQNVIAEIQKDGKNFLVGIHFNQSRNGLEVSSIRGIFPKHNAEWLNWVSQGKTLYLDKEKIQALIDQQRKTLADVEYLDLDSVAKLVNDFENPKLSEEGNASTEQDLTNVSENDTRFSKSNENQRIFVSNAEKAVEGIKQEKGTPEQWLKMIEKGGGLKAGEDKWMGLSDWLKEHKGKSITKQEVLDFIRENQIQIEEVKYEQFGEGLIDEATGKLDAELKEIGWEAMCEKYPGFEELFETYNGELVWSEERASVGEYEDFIIDNKIVNVNPDSNAINETRERYTTEGLKGKREIALTVPSIEPYNSHDEIHFGDAGGGRAIAWVRFGETADKGGSHVLVIDEIQSKRHQDGRENGYQTEEFIQTEKRLRELESKPHRTEEENREYRELMNKMDGMLRENPHPVPDAPFAKNWHELAMKRMLKLAAEEGYDKIAWTKGEQQAERYNIGESVKNIEVNAVTDAETGEVLENEFEVYTRSNSNGGGFITEATGRMNTEQIHEIFGKDLGGRIIEGGRTQSNTIIEGDDLRIGGEGMKGFYDKMLPSFMNKYGKKWGTKVGEVELPDVEEAGRTMWSVDVTPEMKESVMQGQTMFSKKVSEFNAETGEEVRFRKREEPDPKKTQKVYKLMRLGEDGKLYPLYIDNASAVELGQWYNADSPNLGDLKKLPSGIHLIDSEGKATSWEDYKAANNLKGKKPNADVIRQTAENGSRWVSIVDKPTSQKRYEGENRSYYNLGINGSGQVGEFAMRPGWHAGSLPTMRQIGKGKNKDLRDDSFVWVEGEVSADKDYQQEAESNPDKDIPTHIPTDGYYLKATNANKKASQADRVGWYVAGAFKPNRIIGDSEARSIIDKWNAEHPSEPVEYDFPRESGKDFEPEGKSIIDKEVKNVIVNSSESKLPKNRAEAIAAVNEMNKPFINDDQNKEIKVSNKAIRHSSTQDNSHSFVDVRCIGVIDRIIKNAVKIGNIPVAKDEIGKTHQVEVYYCPVNIDGKQHSVRMIVKQYENRGLVLEDFQMYDLAAKQKKSDVLSQGTGNDSLSPLLTSDSAYKVKDLIHNTQENDKKILGIEDKPTLFRVSKEEDKAYMDAVKQGDMDAAREKMLEAAQGAGYDVYGLHGTQGEFTVFDKKRIGSANDEGWLGRGFYFWDKSNREYANQYAGRKGKVMEVFLSMQEPYLIEEREMERLIEASDKHDIETLEAFTQDLKDNGYDSVVDRNGQMLVFDSSQIKSADTVTYNDKGEVIPLSERFNRSNNDIRFSKKRFYDGMSAEEVHDMMGEHAEWSSGPSNLIRELEKHYKGELVSASSGARHAMREGLMPVPGGKYSGQDGEYHHIEFRGKDGETYVESVPFIPAESVGERAGTLFSKSMRTVEPSSGTMFSVRPLLGDKNLHKGLRELKEGEKSHVERVFTENKNFEFSSMNKVESYSDIAYIFRQLEDEAIENSFAVLVKKGKPTVIHLGTGNYTATMVSNSALNVAVNRVNPDKIYFVHNHPSGNLIASRQDEDLLSNLRNLYGPKVADGIIINARSGRYGIYTPSSLHTGADYDVNHGLSDTSNARPIKVYSFSKQVFSPDYQPDALITSSDDVAKFVSSHRLGDRQKLGLIISNNKGAITGNIFLPYSEITNENARDIANDIAYYTSVVGGTRAFMFGNVPLRDVAYKGLSVYVKGFSDLHLLDYVEIDGGRHKSANDEGIRFRFAKTPEEFESVQKEAVEKKGIVTPGLKDKVLNVVDVPRHDFTGSLKDARAEARKWAKDMYHGKEFELPDDGGRYIISNAAIDKYLDATAITNSDNAGIHLSALKELPQIISQSIDAEVHPDYKKGENGVRSAENGVGNDGLLVHRMYGAINIDGETYRVKTTMHEFLNKSFPNTPHSYEVTKIELIESSTADASSRPLNVSTNSISAAKLLNGVEKSYDKGKKLLDESETLTPVNKNAAFRKDYKAEKAQTEDRLLKKTARTFSEMTEGAKFSVAQRIWNDKNEVYKDMREHIKKTSARTGWNQHQGVISYLKSQVGKTNEAMWQDVRNKIAEATGTEPTIVDVQMALWEEGRKGNGPMSHAERIAKRREIVKSIPEAKTDNGEYVESDGVKFSVSPMGASARDWYDRQIKKASFKWEEAHVDRMASLRELQTAVGGSQVKDSENVYDRENHASSIAHAEWQKYHAQTLQPLEKEVGKIISILGRGGKAGKQEITDYLIKKSGLERNRVLFVRDALKEMDDTQKADALAQDFEAEREA